MSSLSVLFLIVVFLTVGLLVAGTAHSGHVKRADRFSLSRPRFSGQWKGPDLTVGYSYSRDENRIDLSGKVVFANFLLYGYTVLQYFQISAIFTDEHGNVLESKGLATDHGGFDQIPFHTTLKLPSGADSIAFSYQGLAEGGHTSFWFYPIY